MHCAYRIEGPFSEELCTGVRVDEEAPAFSSLLSGSENSVTSTDKMYMQLQVYLEERKEKGGRMEENG